jgi:hypothetical protein
LLDRSVGFRSHERFGAGGDLAGDSFIETAVWLGSGLILRLRGGNEGREQDKRERESTIEEREHIHKNGSVI